MTDYKEEQIIELEALEAIYMTELTVLQTKPFPIFTISIQTDESDDSEEQMSTLLKFTYVEKYPDEMPIIEIESSENLEASDEDRLLVLLEEEGQSCLGSVMIFTLVSAAIDWLKMHCDNKKENKIKEIENKKLKDAEEELKKFEGTRVTIESFLLWKAAFDAEANDTRKIQFKIEKNVDKKLTGREMFEKDNTMNESDLQFLQDGEEEVKVDESLFQEMEGLNLEEVEIEDFED